MNSFSNLWQLDVSSKAIKVGEIDYEVENTDGSVEEHTISSDKYSIINDDGLFTTNTTDDSIHANSGNTIIYDGSFNLSTSDDAVTAVYHLKIRGGNINIFKSYEGMEGQTVEISGGVNKIVSSDDGINAANSNLTNSQHKNLCSITISGGQTYVNAGRDGVDSNGSVLISGGELYIAGPTSGENGLLDCETGVIVIGGVLIATGSSTMVETPATNSTQYVMSINLSSSTSGKVSVSYNGNVIASFNAAEVFGTSKNFQSIVISSPEFVNGNTYSVTSGSLTTSVKNTSIVTKVANSAGGPGGGR